MSGLTKIIETIEDQGTAQESAILENAQKQADAILEQSEKEAQAEYDRLMTESEKACAQKKENAVSSARSQAGKALLQAKVNGVYAVIEEAVSLLEHLPTDEYFALLRELIVLHAQKGDGVLLLSENDRKRMPQDFEAQVNDCLKAKDARLTLSADPIAIADGFVLRYGEIEENGTFRALIDADSESIKDTIASILFR